MQGGQLFQVQVPSNWQAVSINNSVKYVPQNGYGEYRGQVTLTHGVELGVARASSHDLNQATQTLIDGFIHSNEGMRSPDAAAGPAVEPRRHPHAARWPLRTGRRRACRRLHDDAADGNLFYYLSVVPEREEGNYTQTFDARRAVESRLERSLRGAATTRCRHTP